MQTQTTHVLWKHLDPSHIISFVIVHGRITGPTSETRGEETWQFELEPGGQLKIDACPDHRVPEAWSYPEARTYRVTTEKGGLRKGGSSQVFHTTPVARVLVIEPDPHHGPE